MSRSIDVDIEALRRNAIDGTHPDHPQCITDLIALWPTLGTSDRRKLHQRICVFPQPCSIDKCQLPLLHQHPYAVCVKSDGERFFLMFTRSTHRAYLIDRKLTFIDVTECFSEIHPNLFAGTLVDGEVVRVKDSEKNNGFRYAFVAFDCITITGTSVAKFDLWIRLAKVKTVVHLVRGACLNVVAKYMIRFQNFYEYCKVATMSENHAIDGYIFTPVNDPVKTGTHRSLFKFKEALANTIDCYLRHGTEKNELHLFSNDERLVSTIHLKPSIY